jgi:transcriptional regulator with XRE-family HTH domain
LASFLNISVDKVISWERAESEPTASELFELSKLYHISIDGLLKSEAAEVSQPISLKKERPDYIRERRPESYTEKEIFPKGYTADTGSSGLKGPWSGEQTLYKQGESRQNYPNITFDEPTFNDIKIETVNSTAQKSQTRSEGDTSHKQSPFELGGIITPETADKIETGLNKAGMVLGSVIDKVADEVHKGIADADIPKKTSQKENYSYNSPPDTAQMYKTPFEQPEQPHRDRHQERLMRKEAKRERKKRAFLLDKLLPFIVLPPVFIAYDHSNDEWIPLAGILFMVIYYIISDHIKIKLYDRKNPPE